MALIEIDGSPFLKIDKNGWIFHGELLNNQMVSPIGAICEGFNFVITVN